VAAFVAFWIMSVVADNVAVDVVIVSVYDRHVASVDRRAVKCEPPRTPQRAINTPELISLSPPFWAARGVHTETNGCPTADEVLRSVVSDATKSWCAQGRALVVLDPERRVDARRRAPCHRWPDRAQWG
jgi:hypothetical protein